MTVTTEGAGPAQAGLQRAVGVEMIGEMAGSGYRIPPSLARRADGQTIQLTPVLYATLHEIDGQRTPAEVAEAVSASIGRSVSEDNVELLVAEQLRPLGLLVQADGSEPQLKKQTPLLGLRFRYAVTDPERTRRFTDPFRFLFRPWMVVPMLAAFAVVCWWVFFQKGLASAAYDAFERPGLLILVFAVTVASAGFHEFGHAAAARYGGSTPGVMGFGLYLVWPAFYTDVTDSYRLGRRGRLRTDLGGLYFNAIVAVAITGVWLWLGYDALLLVVATQILQMLRQLAPLVRFDGYHVLADLTGVPDLYSRIKPTLLGVLPWRWGDPAARLLKPWARVVITVWVVVVIPLLLSTLALAILALPRLMGTALTSLGKQRDTLAIAWVDGDWLQAIARLVAMVAIVIPVAGVVYMLVRLGRQIAMAGWRGSAGKPVKRVLVLVLGAAVLGGLAYAWLPREENYRPIQPWERGTIGDISFALATEALGGPPQRDGSARLVVAPTLLAGQQGVMRAVWDTSAPLPTKGSPQFALVLVPKNGSGGGGGGGFTASGAAPDDGWVFPVNKPLAPDPGDNQALAVNTTDGTTEYVAAFAMIYVTDDSDALNVNEAQAYASCNSCSAVAVAYQVVFVIDNDDTDNNVAAPQNLAGALNYDCVNCLTYAVARQVFVTLDEPLSEEAMAELDVLWAEIGTYEQSIEAGEVPPEEIAAQLDAYTDQIIAIVEADQPGTIPTGTATPTATQTSSPSSPLATPSATTPPTSSSAPPTTSPNAPTTASGTTATQTPSTASTVRAPTTPSGSTSSARPAPSGTTSSDPTAPEGSTSGGTTSGGTASSPSG